MPKSDCYIAFLKINKLKISFNYLGNREKNQLKKNLFSSV